ncbi:MAG: portal protein [Fusobacteriaceae bacterium]
MELQQVKTLYDKAKIYKDGVWEVYKEAMQYGLPNESDVVGDVSLKNPDGLYDSTAMIENGKLARKQVNMILPTNIQWGGLKTDMEGTGNSQDVETLQSYGNNVYKVLINSNLNKESMGFFLNLGVGTACMRMTYTQDMKRPVKFSNIPLPNFSFLEGTSGEVQITFVETQKLRLDQLVGMFPEAPLNGMSADEEYKIMETVVPSDKNIGTYEYIVTLNGFDEELTRVELKYNPFVVCRAIKSGSSIWGNGVLVNVLPNIRNLNNSKYLKRVVGKAGIKPALAFEGDQEHYGKINFELGKMFYMGQRGVNSITPINIANDVNIELMNIEDDIKQIRDGMFSSYISNLDMGGVQPKSSTEWNIRHSEFLEIFSANYNMVEEEFLIPIFMNTLYILSELSYNEMDSSIIDNEEISPVFFNKLTENYKQENIEKLNGMLGNLMNIMGSPQGVLGVLNLDLVVGKMADWFDVDRSLMKDEGEIQQFLEQYLQSMLQQGGEQ